MQKYNISKEKVFNNLNNELHEFFYGNITDENKNVIDFDILEYEEYDHFFDENNKINIRIKLLARVVKIESENIISSEKEIDLILIQNEITEHEKGIYMIKCNGCGATIQLTSGECEYCKRKINYLQNWYIKEIKIKD